MKKIFILLFISITILAQTSDSFIVTYIANDGFLLSHKGKKILIDALFHQGFGKYDPPSDVLIPKIINGEKPFDKIDLYLVTHNHGDHFYSQYVNSFLKNHSKAQFVSSAEVCNQLKNDNAIKNQVKDISVEIGASVDTVMNEIPLKIFRLKHLMDTTGTRIINFAFLADLNGIKIFHPGDISFVWDKPFLDKFDLAKEKINILFIPYFDLSEASVKYVKEVIKPKHIIAKHIPPGEFKDALRNFLTAYPEGIVFEKPMDKKIFTD